MPARSTAWHLQVHGRGPLAYNMPLRLWHGSPLWAKIGAGGFTGALGYAASEVEDDD